MTNEWTTIRKQIGHIGKKRNEQEKEYNLLYGQDNWRVMWLYQGKEMNYLKTCKVYEQAYYIDSFNRKDIWLKIRENAYNVYDTNELNIKSGLNYLIQEDIATHIQDIAIRNVFKRRNWEFNGDKLIQIRRTSEYDYARKLSPATTPFHDLNEIIQPSLKGWWEKNTVEDFYQSNKILQVRTN